MIPLLQTADTAHTGIFASVPYHRVYYLWPYPNFWAGAGDEASGEQPLVARARVSVCPSLATPRATNTIVNRAQHLLSGHLASFPGLPRLQFLLCEMV